MNRFWFIQGGRCAPALNMAFDEALLLSARSLGPVLRCYAWAEPAATFGYFQKYTDVEQLTPLRPLIRRPTGGGIVPHASDWTYSVAFPPSHEWHSVPAVESYRRIHAWIQAALARMGIVTELAPSAVKAAAGQCFIGHEQHDLLWNGRKIAGAAQRRNRNGLLIEGSVQPPSTKWDRRAWESAMLAAQPSARFEPLPAEALRDLGTLAERLAREKYSQPGYNQKR